MPVISNLVYTKTDTTIVATWTTDVSSDSNLTVGGLPGNDNGLAANSTSHQCIKTGLTPSTLYSCTVTSGGSSSSPQNVTTNASPTRIFVTSVSFGSPTKTNVHGDTFYNCVSDDNNTYITEDDGFGFVTGTPNAGANMQIGRLTNEATLVGVTTNLLTAYGAFSTTNGSDGPGGVALSNKLSGLFGMGGSLYAFQTRQDRTVLFPETQWFANIMRSNDHGATWNSWQAPAVFNANGVPPSPLGSSMFTDGTIGWITPCRYAVDDGTLGYNTAGNQIDGANAFVYIVFTDGNWNNGSNLYLMRVLRIQMAAQVTTAFQYWNGPASPTPTDFVKDSNWSNSSGTKRAIYSAANQASAPDMVFVPAINSYLLLTWYQPTNSASNSVWTILAGPTPAGPWTQVGTQTNSPSGYYNPVVMHRTVATNILTNNIPLTIAYSGDYDAGFNTFYFPTYSTLTLRTGGSSVPLSIAHFTSGGASGTSTTTVLPAISTTTGNLIVVSFRLSNSGSTDVTSITDTAGNTYTQVPNSTVSPTAAGSGCTTYYAKNITGNAANVITITYRSATPFTAVAVWEIAGADTVSPLDGPSAGTSYTTLSVTSTSRTYTTAKQLEIALAFCSCNSVNQTFTAGSGFTTDIAAIPTGAGLAYTGEEKQILSSAQSGATASISFNVASTATAFNLVAFKSAGGSIAGNAGVAGATVTYSGASAGSVVADGSGNYTIPNLINGSYTITPSLAGYTFSPTNSSQSVDSNNVTGVNFTATAIPPAPSPGGGGPPLGGFNFDFTMNVP